MLAGLVAAQTYLLPLPAVKGSILTAGNGLVLSLIFGAAGAFVISRFATELPPPPPSKTQQRKLAAAAARSKTPSDEEDEDEGELVTARARTTSSQRRRRRRR